MADVVYNPIHSDQAVALLLSQFKGKPRIEALLRSYTDQIQDLEDAFFALYALRWVDTADDAQLDDLGDLVGYARNGLLDSDYRRFIKAKIRVNVSTGKNEELLAILVLILGDPATTGEPIRMREYDPKAIDYEANGVTTNSLLIWRDFLKPAADGGVNLHFIASAQPTANTLICDSVYGGVNPTTTQNPESTTAVGTGGVTSACFGEP